MVRTGIKTSRNMLMELRKVCQHTYLAAPDFENLTLSDEEQHKRLISGSGKLQFLSLLLPKLRERGHRVLLFSQFKMALDRIEDFLIGEGVKFLRLDGDVQQAQRQKDMDAFNAPDSDYFIFLLTTRAGGVGINLATADTVIIFDPDFNPHQDLQAIARAHRYGQKKKVLVFKLMTKSSCEEKIIMAGKKKMVLDHLVVQSMDTTHDEGDIDSILLHGTAALYEKEVDGVAASDVVYNSKNVEELIDKVEREAEEEAERMAERDKEEAAAEARGEKVEAGAREKTFGFARIWEAEQGLQEVREEDEEEVDVQGQEAGMASMLEHVEAERERERQEEAERRLTRYRASKSKVVGVEAEEDTTPKKKGRKGKGGKGKKGKSGPDSDEDFAPRAESESDESDLEGEAEAEAMLDEMGRPMMVGGLTRLVVPTAPASVAAHKAAAAASAVAAAGKTMTVEEGRAEAKRIKVATKTVERRKLIAANTAMQERARAGLTASMDPNMAYPAPSVSVPAAALALTHSDASATTLSNGPATPSAEAIAAAAAAAAALAQEIQHGRYNVQWLYHLMRELGYVKEITLWSRAADANPALYVREGYYKTGAGKVDDFLSESGNQRYFLQEGVARSVRALINSREAWVLDEDPEAPAQASVQAQESGRDIGRERERPMLPYPEGEGQGRNVDPYAEGGAYASRRRAQVQGQGAGQTKANGSGAGAGAGSGPGAANGRLAQVYRVEQMGQMGPGGQAQRSSPVAAPGRVPTPAVQSLAPNTSTSTSTSASSSAPGQASRAPTSGAAGSSTTQSVVRPGSHANINPVPPVSATPHPHARTTDPCPMCSSTTHTFLQCMNRPPLEQVRGFRAAVLQHEASEEDKVSAIAFFAHLEGYLGMEGEGNRVEKVVRSSGVSASAMGTGAWKESGLMSPYVQPRGLGTDTDTRQWCRFPQQAPRSRAGARVWYQGQEQEVGLHRGALERERERMLVQARMGTGQEPEQTRSWNHAQDYLTQDTPKLQADTSRAVGPGPELGLRPELMGQARSMHEIERIFQLYRDAGVDPDKSPALARRSPAVTAAPMQVPARAQTGAMAPPTLTTTAQIQPAMATRPHVREPQTHSQLQSQPVIRGAQVLPVGTPEHGAAGTSSTAPPPASMAMSTSIAQPAAVPPMRSRLLAPASSSRLAGGRGTRHDAINVDDSSDEAERPAKRIKSEAGAGAGAVNGHGNGHGHGPASSRVNGGGGGADSSSSQTTPSRPAAAVKLDRRRGFAGCEICMAARSHIAVDCPVVRAGSASIANVMEQFARTDAMYNVLEDLRLQALAREQRQQQQRQQQQAQAGNAGADAGAVDAPCAFCLTRCGKELRACVEVHGGRVELKSVLRKLNASDAEEDDQAEKRSAALYALYQQWPR